MYIFSFATLHEEANEGVLQHHTGLESQVSMPRAMGGPLLNASRQLRALEAEVAHLDLEIDEAYEALDGLMEYREAGQYQLREKVGCSSSSDAAKVTPRIWP